MNSLTDADHMKFWYKFMADRPESVNALLAWAREHTGQSAEEQRLEMGASPQAFERLCAFFHPRLDHLIDDAQRMAETCGLTHPEAFVRVVTLAKVAVTYKPGWQFVKEQLPPMKPYRKPAPTFLLWDEARHEWVVCQIASEEIGQLPQVTACDGSIGTRLLLPEDVWATMPPAPTMLTKRGNEPS